MATGTRGPKRLAREFLRETTRLDELSKTFQALALVDLPPSYTHMHTYAHACTYTHTRIHTHTHT